MAYGPPGRCCGEVGCPTTCARRNRTAPTTTSTSDVPIGRTGDVYDRYLVRMQEMRESLKIITQAFENLPDGP